MKEENNNKKKYHHYLLTAQINLMSLGIILLLAIVISATTVTYAIEETKQSSSSSLFPASMIYNATLNSTLNIVWQDDTSGNNETLFAKSTDGGATFSDPINVSNDSTDSARPQIVLGQDNTIDIIWNDATLGEVFLAKSTDGGATFSDPINVSNDSTNSDSPQIAVDSKNTIYALWTIIPTNNSETPFNTENLLAKSTDGGATFSDPINVSNSPKGTKGPAIAIDSNRTIYLTWFDTSPGNPEIFFTKSTDGGATFSDPINVSNDPLDSVRPEIAVNKNNVYLIWYNIFPGYEKILLAKSTDGGATFSDPINVSNNLGLSSNPQIAVDPNNNVYVVWKDAASSHPIKGNAEIFFTKSTDGGATFSDPINVSNDSTNSQEPQIVLGQDNNIINVIWHDATLGEVFLAKSTDGGATFSDPINVSITKGLSIKPQLAIDYINK